MLCTSHGMHDMKTRSYGNVKSKPQVKLKSNKEGEACAGIKTLFALDYIIIFSSSRLDCTSLDKKMMV